MSLNDQDMLGSMMRALAINILQQIFPEDTVILLVLNPEGHVAIGANTDEPNARLILAAAAEGEVHSEQPN